MRAFFSNLFRKQRTNQQGNSSSINTPTAKEYTRLDRDINIGLNGSNILTNILRGKLNTIQTADKVAAKNWTLNEFKSELIKLADLCSEKPETHSLLTELVEKYADLVKLTLTKRSQKYESNKSLFKATPKTQDLYNATNELTAKLTETGFMNQHRIRKALKGIFQSQETGNMFKSSKFIE